MKLINSFHGTEYNARAIKTVDDLENLAYALYSGDATDAEKALARRINNALCPSHKQGCKCGGFLHADKRGN